MESPPSLLPSSPAETLNLDTLRALKLLGKGATGTVLLVHDVISDPSASSPFALKLVEKSSSASSLRRAQWEIRVLRRLTHDADPNPFLPNLLGTVDSPELLAWAVPYCHGGDLNVHRYRQNDGVFSSTVIRFYLAEIVCALEHLHSMGIAYRDLKPENILIQQSGHVTLTDFDLSRSLQRPKPVAESEPDLKLPGKPRRSISRWVSLPTRTEPKTGLKKTRSARVNPLNRRRASFSCGDRSNSFVGTDEYVSPEILLGEGHDFSVDWWALGVLTYEMMYGKTPFKGKNKKETYKNVLTKEPEFTGKPSDLTDFIRGLLVKDPTLRLGRGRGAAEIKEHRFFAGVRWDLLTEVTRPPFIPLRDDGELTEILRASGGFSVKEHFERLTSPPSPSATPSAPLGSPPHECCKDNSFIEF